MRVSSCLLLSVLLLGCDDGSDNPGAAFGEALDPMTAPRAAVDRFADARAGNPSVPAPDAPVDFDAQFFTRALGPDGEPVAYYDFGLSSGFTMPVYRLVDETGAAIEGQLPIIASLPGQPGYSDFWQVTQVEVPPGYISNSITSAAELLEAELEQQLTVEVFNRPVVPAGSTAEKGERTEMSAWFDDQVATAFEFAEAPVQVRGSLVDYVPIYVCMTEAGFCAEDDGSTHNVVAATPADDDYSPLWGVEMYPADAFDAVRDLETALAAGPEKQPGLVNCPLVEW